MDDDQAIGQRVRLIRKRRGLSLDEAAGLAGIGKSYLSKLETGQRRFIRRGLLEDVASALGCSFADLTGQPYLPVDRAGADALATLPGISIALHECSLSDVPDIPARSVAELAAMAAEANHNVDSCPRCHRRRRRAAGRVGRTRGGRYVGRRDRPFVGQRGVGHGRGQAGQRGSGRVRTSRAGCVRGDDPDRCPAPVGSAPPRWNPARGSARAGGATRRPVGG